MINWSIDDYGLTAQQLEEKYEKKGAHPSYEWGTFRMETESQDELDSDYWIWVVSKLQDEQATLDSDSPYN